MRLLKGNWKIRAAAGDYFQRSWFGSILDAGQVPSGLRLVRYWDLAATKKRTKLETSDTKKNGPDWVSGFLLGFDQALELYYILDIARFRGTPREVEAFVKLTAEMDGKKVDIVIEQEPGSSGVFVVDRFIRSVLRGYTVYAKKTTGDKVSRVKPFSAATQAGNVKLVRSRHSDYIPDFLKEAEGFPDAAYDDQVDSGSGAFEYLSTTPTLQVGRAKPRG
jgi:predicted phage terminase large subunit-like protein